MDKAELLSRLRDANPGWPEWNELIQLVESLEFEHVEEKYLGAYLTCGSRLSFNASEPRNPWPDWMPNYVAAIFGMKADEYVMAGGFADSFDGLPTEERSVFASGGTDDELGFPLIKPPENVYSFQSNSSGALFHIDTELRVLYPDAESATLKVLDNLEDFTKTNIRQALNDEDWFTAYDDLDATLLD